MNPTLLLAFGLLFCSGGGGGGGLLGSSSLVDGASTIGPGEELNSTSVLVSEGGNFTLGFFNLSERSYLGIWYSKDDRRVWVANPNTPILPPSTPVLTIDNNGILKIASGGNTLLNISDQVRENPIAKLQDSGNFLLTDETQKQIFWQSFDHPTDTLLPGMKLGYNSLTGQNWTLTSWLSDSIPSSGAFSLSWEPAQESGQLVMYRQAERYWTSGLLKDQTFEFAPEFDDSFELYNFNLSYTSNKDEKYFTFSALNGGLQMWILYPNGGLLNVANSRVMKREDFCYGNEKDDSRCEASGPPKCRNRNDEFKEKRADFLYQSQYDNNPNMSISDCMEYCWFNCSCVAFTVNSNGTGCITWMGKLEHREDNVNAEIKYVLVRGDSSKVKARVWIVIAVAISLLLLILATLCCLRMRKRRLKEEERKRRKEYLKQLVASDGLKNESDEQDEGMEGQDLKILSFASIAEATNNFSIENKLGQGGFGPVYRGKLQEGREIAVKRLSRASGQGLVEFKNELILIAKLQHTNLVRVLGCCIHGEEKLLIYEYLPNKSLDFFLFDPTKRELLNWKKRLNIIEGIAQGMLYLHRYSRMRVIHRDLKASNILLDEDMNPKISDFGMARIFKPHEMEGVTNRVVGTYGYMSPEYAMEGNFSMKSDVFSFGVLILEIVSGRKNSSFYHFDDRPLNLIGYAWELWKAGTALELRDPTLGDNSCDKNKLLRIIHVGLLCVQEGAADRPTMSDVTCMLGNDNMALPAPKQPAFFTGRNVLDTAASNTSNSKDCSVNGLTISVMEAR